MDTMHTRRIFLKRGLTVLSAAATMPAFLQRTVYAMNNPADMPLTQDSMGIGEEILVVIQMSGGNDGLSTVIPLDNDDYRRARPQLAIAQNLLKLSSSVALHPDLTSFKEMFDAGTMAVIQGVGYPNPNRSHFRSMEIWHTADPKNPPKEGWLGRYFDAQCSGSEPKTAARNTAGPAGRGAAAKQKDAENTLDPKAAINIGPTSPLALQGNKFTAISFQNPQSYQWFAGNRNVDPKLKAAFAEVNDLHGNEGAPVSTGNPTLDFLERTALDAQLTSDEILAVTSRYRPTVSYPATPLGQQLQMVAQMIAGGLKTRVYYVSLGGFDTHTNEKATHDRLMQTMSAGVGAFMKDLKNQGNDQRTVVMTFSEFGRRVVENASRGTDHGTAAPMFVWGPRVKGGVYGDHPSLSPGQLDQGDLRFHTDFRSVYATILEGWLRADSAKILGGNFKTMPLIGIRA